MRYVLVPWAWLAVVTIAFAYPNNPPMGYAGDPPDYNSCVNCHDSYALNSGDGYLQISGLPSAGYESGATYSLTVTLTDPGQVRWGFELTVIQERNGNYLQAGELIVTDPTHTNLGVGSGSAPDYVRQTSEGTYNGTSGPTSWNFDWTAPDTSVGLVTFYTAGAACNDGSGANGDYVYTDSVQLEPEIPSFASPPFEQAPADFALFPASPNPFNPSTTIRFDLPQATRVKLEVFDISGSLMATLADGLHQAGSHEVTFDGSHLASGIYIYQLQAGKFKASGKMVLIK